MQPPSGGCVLKLKLLYLLLITLAAATFGWLCVETKSDWRPHSQNTAATFGWLCVETTLSMRLVMVITAATFGWLCVETTTKRKTR